MMKRLSLALILFVAGLQGANAASFDCHKAELPAEHAICANANLSRLDEQTAGMYWLIVSSGAPAATVQQVKESQVAFLKRRNACQSNGNCLVDAYTDQMMYLSNEKSNLGL